MILHGDSLHVLKTLEDESVDLVCTDPPYGYSFMGKDWDRAVPSVEIWQECLRVLKPGAFCFVMSAPRSDVQNAMISRLMEAGFRLDFTPIYWTYASGFPKAGNIGKLVDKRLGAEREEVGPHPYANRGTAQSKQSVNMSGSPERSQNITAAASPEAKALDGSYAGFQPKPAVEVIIVAMKPLSEKTYVDQALANGKGVTWLDDCRVPTDTPPQPFGNPTDRFADGASGFTKQEYIPNQSGRFPANLLVSSDVLGDDYSRFFTLDKWADTLPFLQVAKASKREKNEGLNRFNCAIIDICQDENTEQVTSLLKDILESIPNLNIVESGLRLTVQSPMDTMSTTLTTINQITDLKTYTSLMQSPTRESMKAALSKMTHGTSPAKFVESSSVSTKTTGISAKKAGLVTDAVSSAIYEKLLTLKDSDVWKPNSNIHPTCKPTKLMSYLITLGSRPGDTVLDPFVGSGTTAVAAQNLGRQPIGIEREAEYVEIAQARLAHHLPVHKPVVQLPPEQPEPGVPPVTIPDITGDISQLSLL